MKKIHNKHRSARFVVEPTLMSSKALNFATANRTGVTCNKPPKRLEDRNHTTKGIVTCNKMMSSHTQKHTLRNNDVFTELHISLLIPRLGSQQIFGWMDFNDFSPRSCEPMVSSRAHSCIGYEMILSQNIPQELFFLNLSSIPRIQIHVYRYIYIYIPYKTLPING